MEFDKSKVYTALNADELKFGCEGYFADALKELRNKVAENDTIFLNTLRSKEENGFVSYDGRFFNFFYLVKEQKEKMFHPYKDTDEMIEDFKKRYSSYGGWNGKDNPMYNPLIWVKDKKIKRKCLATGFYTDNDGDIFVRLDCAFCSMSALLDNYTYLDGSPCGIEEAAE